MLPPAVASATFDTTAPCGLIRNSVPMSGQDEHSCCLFWGGVQVCRSTFEEHCAANKVELPYELLTQLYEVGCCRRGGQPTPPLREGVLSMVSTHLRAIQVPSSAGRLPALPARATCAVLPLAPLPLQEPDNLDLIQDRHLRMQARACINHAVDEEYLKAWAHCTAGGRAAPPPRPLLNVRACRPLCSRPNPCT